MIKYCANYCICNNASFNMHCYIERDTCNKFEYKKLKFKRIKTMEKLTTIRENRGCSYVKNPRGVRIYTNRYGYLIKELKLQSPYTTKKAFWRVCGTSYLCNEMYFDIKYSSDEIRQAYSFIEQWSFCDVRASKVNV